MGIFATMYDQPKVERMLRLMQMMSGPVNYSLDELSDKLDMSRRTIYRYIETFKEVGFAVTKVHGDVWRIFKSSRKGPDFENLVCFSEEEAYIVNSLIDRLDPTNTLKGNLKRKLATIYGNTPIAEFVDKKDNASNIEALTAAIEDHRKAILHKYESGHTKTVRDRLVEPYGFTTNYVDVQAFDLEDGTNKIFKISRVDSVEVLEEEWTRESDHKGKVQDVFRMTGDPTERICLKLSPMAKSLLVEEFPLAERDLTRKGDDWFLETDISSVYGAGRFVLGLPGEVEIAQGSKLREYIRMQVSKNLLSYLE